MTYHICYFVSSHCSVSTYTAIRLRWEKFLDACAAECGINPDAASEFEADLMYFDAHFKTCQYFGIDSSFLDEALLNS